jgi:hypothetical protein
VNDDPFIDGLEDARAYLLEHEVGRNVVIVWMLSNDDKSSLLVVCFYSKIITFWC